MKILRSFSAVVLAGILAMIATSISFAAVQKQVTVERTEKMTSAQDNHARRHHHHRRRHHRRNMAHMTRSNAKLTNSVLKKKSLTNESY
jgi:hypothetical protein